MGKKQTSNSLFGDNIFKNLLLIIGSAILLFFLVILLLNLYTRHGQQVEIPSLEGLQAEEANRLLKAKGLHAEIVDSIYFRDGVPGAVIDQTPKAGNKVKEGRAIYITIYSRSPQLISVPGLTDYSIRQAMAVLTSMGFSQIGIEETPAEYAGLVVAVKYHGKPLAAEEKVPAASPLTLVVTKAYDNDSLFLLQEQDSLQKQPSEELNNSSNKENGESEVNKENGAIDDSFF